MPLRAGCKWVDSPLTHSHTHTHTHTHAHTYIESCSEQGLGTCWSIPVQSKRSVSGYWLEAPCPPGCRLCLCYNIPPTASHCHVRQSQTKDGTRPTGDSSAVHKAQTVLLLPDALLSLQMSMFNQSMFCSFVYSILEAHRALLSCVSMCPFFLCVSFTFASKKCP